MDEVHTYIQGILRNLAKLGVLQVIFESDLPLADAVTLIERVWQRLDVPVDPLIGQGGVAASPKGPVITVHGLKSKEQATDLLKRLAEGIAAEGKGGSLRPIARISTPVRSASAQLFGVVAGLCVEGHADPVRPTVWVPAPGAMEALIETALDWCMITGGTHYVSVAMASYKCTADQRRALVITGLSSDSATSLTCTAGPEEIRYVSFGYEGTVYFGRLDPQNSWEPALSDLTDVVASLADHLQYAAIRRSRLQKAQWFNFLDHWWPERPYLEYGMSQAGRVVADTYIPDAFGAQLLGPGHKLPPLSEQWHSRPVGSDSTLLTHTDPKAWYEGAVGSVPDTQILKQARRELAPLLLTDERAQAGHKQQFAHAPPPRLRLP